MYTCTKVFEVKALMAQRLGLDEGKIVFSYKAGCSWRSPLQYEEMPTNVIVLGIKSFKREKHSYKSPHAIIGAGHLGLKTAMKFLLNGEKNFILFDRRPQVGGTSWWEQANETSRLQTEVGAYHLQYEMKDIYKGKEFGLWPKDSKTNPWPKVQALRQNFIEVAEGCGVMPYCKMNTNVAKLSVIGSKTDYMDQSYELVVEPYFKLGGEKPKGKKLEEELFQVSSVCMYPGNLTIPKRVVYKGEEAFQGDIVYGIGNNYDYKKCNGKNVVMIGSGAFAMENVRTCVEHHVKKVFIVCRRKNMSMPRVVSWYINQSFSMISANMMLQTSLPMYDLIGVDPYSYYSVYANEARTNVNMRQNSRFGIGDVYFLAMYWGKCEHIVDDVKRVSDRTIHLVNGRALEDIESLLKLLGFNGNFDVDTLMKIKDLYGFWANKDHRRRILAEPIGVDAANFGGTSFSPGALNWTDEYTYFLDYPKDWIPIRDSNMLPSHAADESKDRPAYVVEARHGAITGLTVNAMCPGIQERAGQVATLKRERMWDCNPIESFLEAAAKEWDAYSDQFIAEGWAPHLKKPPYPYTLPMVMSYLKAELDDIQNVMGSEAAEVAAKLAFPEGRAAFDKYSTSMLTGGDGEE